ncbi:hypothetical protein EUGRSUZ_F03983 [Eucalyptus grandis]|uniref:Uncharacterized protein n=2 Tax=Eucalyptus grandis TaxID=71139 RepID=A0ACC3KP80_EUCGR|nr:hypothetical protein EUGRSUZ_F03983 [Eucalyptus grandis]
MAAKNGRGWEGDEKGKEEKRILLSVVCRVDMSSGSTLLCTGRKWGWLERDSPASNWTSPKGLIPGTDI